MQFSVVRETGIGKEVLTNTIKEFEKANLGIEVNINFIPSDYQIKMAAMSVSDTLPDVGYFYGVLRLIMGGKQ